MESPTRQELASHPIAASNHLLRTAIETLHESEISRIDLEPGEALTSEGTYDSRLFVVLEGEVAVEAESGIHTEVRFRPGDVVGEVSYLTGMPRTTGLVAVGPAAIAAISGELDDDAAPELRSLAAERLKASMLMSLLAEVFDIRAADELQAFAAAASIEDIPLGADLFAHADGVALVLLGSFRVMRPEGVIARVGRGEILGEMSWLNGTGRIASVFAARDAIVARFEAETFEELVRANPSALLVVTKLLAKRLSRDPIFRLTKPPRPMSVAVIAAHPRLDTEALTRSLAESIPSAAVITQQVVERALAKPGAGNEAPGSARGLAVDTWLGLEEPRHEFVLLAGSTDALEWNRRVVRHADRVVLLVDAREKPDETAVESRLAEELETSQVELMFVHPDDTAEPKGTLAWLAPRQVRRHHHIRRTSRPDIARAARRLAGLARGLVLGGGGARGYASIGVGQALEDARLEIDVFGGTSMGALIAAALAYRGAEFAADMADRYGSRRHLHDTTLPLTSVFASRRVTAMLQTEFGDLRIEDMWKPFFAVATNLSTAEQLVLEKGSLWEAVRASIAIPGVFSPVSSDGDLLVDGGIMNNLPIDVMRTRCEEGAVIAVNVSPRTAGHRWDIEPYQSGWSQVANRLNPFRETQRAPSIAGTVLRSLDTNSVARLRAHMDLADLVIQPDVKEFSILDWDSHRNVVEAGRLAAAEALSDWEHRPAD